MGIKNQNPLSNSQKIESLDINQNNVSDSNNKEFVNRKRIIFISISIIISIIMVIITILYVLKIDFKDLGKLLHETFARTDADRWWVVPLFAYIFFKIFFTYHQYYIKLKDYGIKWTFWDKISFGSTVVFLFAVTPANFVTDPFAVYWLRKKGLKMHEAVTVTIGCSLICQVAQIIVTIPSFVMVCMQYHNLINVPGGHATFWLMFIGLSINVINVAFLSFSGVSRKFHILISKIWNTILRWLHLKYKSNLEIVNEYYHKNSIKKEFNSFFKDYKKCIYLFFLYSAYEIFTYFCVWFSLEWISPSEISVNLLWSFNAGNIGFTANKFIPLPGGEGTIEYFLQTILTYIPEAIKNNGYEISKEEFANHGILIWRTFTTYIPAILGLFGVWFLIGKQIKINKQNKAVNNA